MLIPRRQRRCVLPPAGPEIAEPASPPTPATAQVAGISQLHVAGDVAQTGKRGSDAVVDCGAPRCMATPLQPELWPGRRVGAFTAEEHQQLLFGVRTFGRDWARVQRMHLPSRSCDEVREYAEARLPNARMALPPPALLESAREALKWTIALNQARKRQHRGMTAATQM